MAYESDCLHNPGVVLRIGSSGQSSAGCVSRCELSVRVVTDLGVLVLCLPCLLETNITAGLVSRWVWWTVRGAVRHRLDVLFSCFLVEGSRLSSPFTGRVEILNHQKKHTGLTIAPDQHCQSSRWHSTSQDTSHTNGYHCCLSFIVPSITSIDVKLCYWRGQITTNTQRHSTPHVVQSTNHHH